MNLLPLLSLIVQGNTGSDKEFKHTWGVEFYNWTVEITALVLVVAYGITFCRVWAGTRYPFILVLTTLLFLSSMGSGMAGMYNHRMEDLINDDVIDRE